MNFPGVLTSHPFHNTFHCSSHFPPETAKHPSLHTTMLHSSRLTVLVFAILAFVLAAVASPVCPPNEVYNDCASSCKKEICPSKVAQLEVRCVDVCVEGCFCASGHGRDPTTRKCLPCA
ncbi:MAG: hypothetical protein BYD32DRAFT_272931 [Podila humilis]|nr:MAG: hypothetical protein BYD32DRAFT_272931 [Podila humilis]